MSIEQAYKQIDQSKGLAAAYGDGSGTSTPHLESYTFQDGDNYIFENGTNFEFN